MDVKDGCDDVNYIRVTHDRHQCLFLVNIPLVVYFILGLRRIYFVDKLRRSVPEAPIPHFMVSGNSSIRVTNKPFGAKSVIFTKMWVRHLWY
jgi:hypothetical protein